MVSVPLEDPAAFWSGRCGLRSRSITQTRFVDVCLVKITNTTVLWNYVLEWGPEWGHLSSMSANTPSLVKHSSGARREISWLRMKTTT